MRKIIELTSLGIVVATVTTIVLSVEYVDEVAAQAAFDKEMLAQQRTRELMEKGKMDDTSLKEALVLAFGVSTEQEWNVVFAKELMRTIEIPRERQIRVLEDMIREGLSAIEKDKAASVRWDTSYDILPLLEGISNYDAIPIIKECLKSKSEDIRCNAVKTYINMEAVKSIPLVREAIENKELTDRNRISLYRNLERAAEKLKENNKDDDVSKINSFLNEMKRAEQVKEKGEK
jgi:predicted transcriptional regulator